MVGCARQQLLAREAALVGPSERPGRLVHVVHVRVVHPTLKRVLASYRPSAGETATVTIPLKPIAVVSCGDAPPALPFPRPDRGRIFQI